MCTACIRGRDLHACLYCPPYPHLSLPPLHTSHGRIMSNPRPRAFFVLLVACLLEAPSSSSIYSTVRLPVDDGGCISSLSLWPHRRSWPLRMPSSIGAECNTPMILRSILICVVAIFLLLLTYIDQHTLLCAVVHDLH